MPPRGRRVSLADLDVDLAGPAVQSPLTAAAAPPGLGGPEVPIDTVAANPFNPRDLTSERARSKVAEIRDSIKANGQLAPCAVVTRDAFLRIYPDHADQIGPASFVQVNGGRRRAAILDGGLATIKVDINDALAETRVAFLRATTAENIDREDFDPIEEALAIEGMANELGTSKAAAEALNRTPAWATQRLNLLKLAPEVQAALRGEGLALREVRDWHKLTAPDQIALLTQWRRRRAAEDATMAGDEPTGDEDKTEPARRGHRLSPLASAIHKLGDSPPRIAMSLRSQLPADDLRALVAELQRLLTEA